MDVLQPHSSIEYLLHKPDNLADALNEQGAKIRDLRAQAGEHWRFNPEVLDAVWCHLALKSWDYDLGNVLPEHRGPRTIKIRWRLGNDPNSKRFQNIFPNRFYLTGAEVRKAIQIHMLKPKIIQKHGDLGGFLKIELLSTGNKGPSVALTDEYLVKMPIMFPGPMMAFNHTFEFRIHWAGTPYHTTTPLLLKESIPELIDSGVNLFDKGFAHNMPTVVARAFQAGVSQMVLISVDAATTRQSIAIADHNQNSLFATCGVHPMSVPEFTDHFKTELKDVLRLNRKKIFAIGECGMDVVKVQSTEEKQATAAKELQQQWFSWQLELAGEQKLPVLVHSRGCHVEVFELLKDAVAKYPDLVIIFNCFTGDANELKDLLGLKKEGVYFIITGIIASDDRGADLRSVVPLIPDDRLLIGSDAPHLTPFNMSRPFPRRNEPAFMQHTLFFLADLLKKEPQRLAKQTTFNARKAYGLPTVLYDGRLPPGPRPLDFTEFQKSEEAKPKPAPQAKKGKAEKPKRLVLEGGQDFFSVSEEGKTHAFLVSEKEKAILAKQSALKTVPEIIELASVMECKPIAPNTHVFKAGGEKEEPVLKV